MALRQLTKSFAPNSKQINYLNKTFPEFRQSLIDFAKVYFPDTYTDFNETSPGMMFIEMASYVGDVLSYYIDTQFRENLMEYAQELDNVVPMAQAFGYKPRPSTAAQGRLDVYQICPALGIDDDYLPDSRFLLRISPGMILSSPQYGVMFRTTEILDFADKNGREITVYSVDGMNNPLTYLVKKTIKVVSGTVTTYQYDFGSPERFSSIELPEDNVLEIIKVEDSNGYRWYEVDFLAQDLVFEDKTNINALVETNSLESTSLAPYYFLKVKKQPRRFITRYNSDYKLELQFGSGIVDDTDATVNLEPGKVANSEYETNLASTTLDPTDFLYTNSYGLAPANTTMTITYSVGGGLESNVPGNSITTINEVVVENDLTGFTGTQVALFRDIKNSLAVNNPEPATGGADFESIDEIKRNALAFFNAQNRLVSPEDYVVRCYAMPPKYGAISKAFVARQDQILKVQANKSTVGMTNQYVDDNVAVNKVNLYVLGYNKDKKLVPLNYDTKLNLKRYLEQYRILTDEINILDGFVVNIKVNFSITVFRNFNMNEVLARCIDAISNFFDIDKWDINQPIIINDLLLEIASQEGVQTITGLRIGNRYRHRDGLDYNVYLYDIADAIDGVDGDIQSGIIYPSLDPCIFELRYPDRDIIGNAKQ